VVALNYLDRYIPVWMQDLHVNSRLFGFFKCFEFAAFSKIIPIAQSSNRSILFAPYKGISFHWLPAILYAMCFQQIPSDNNPFPRHTHRYAVPTKIRALANADKIHPVQGRAMIVTDRNPRQIFIPLTATHGRAGR
jgi:hypothetical protein